MLLYLSKSNMFIARIVAILITKKELKIYKVKDLDLSANKELKGF